MSKEIAYCSLDPDFPETGYIGFLFILHDDNLLGTLPLDTIYTSIDHASEGIKAIFEQIKGTQKKITIPQECVLISIKKQSLLPLKKNYWKNPQINYSEHSRVTTFSPVLENPSLFSLLVTPFSYDDVVNKWYFTAAMPLYHKFNPKTIEAFMKFSDYVVEPRAKTAAIYTLEQKVRFNWMTKEIKEFEHHKTIKPKEKS